MHLSILVHTLFLPVSCAGQRLCLNRPFLGSLSVYRPPIVEGILPRLLGWSSPVHNFRSLLRTSFAGDGCHLRECEWVEKCPGLGCHMSPSYLMLTALEVFSSFVFNGDLFKKQSVRNACGSIRGRSEVRRSAWWTIGRLTRQTRSEQLSGVAGWNRKAEAVDQRRWA